MPCFHPLRAWRTQTGEIHLAKEPPDSNQLRLPCGNCLGCRMARAQAWAFRCRLELQQHNAAAFTTLTYDEAHCPPTLEKRHLQLWLKRFRKRAAQPIRFFASGEYGERNGRPHYHAILYGVSESAAGMVADTWTAGLTKTVNVTPAAISYVAGYTAKKIGYRYDIEQERVDPDTGEVYTYQPPFTQMSRRPGIGAHARQHWNSWRLYAISDGYRMPVPRYLHEAWKNNATAEQKEALELEKIKLTILRDTSTLRLEATEKIAEAQQRQRAERREL